MSELTHVELAWLAECCKGPAGNRPLEALDIDPADAAPKHWRHIHNRLSVEHRASTRATVIKRRSIGARFHHEAPLRDLLAALVTPAFLISAFRLPLGVRLIKRVLACLGGQCTAKISHLASMESQRPQRSRATGAGELFRMNRNEPAVAAQSVP